jgi:hypothetical protein
MKEKDFIHSKYYIYYHTTDSVVFGDPINMGIEPTLTTEGTLCYSIVIGEDGVCRSVIEDAAYKIKKELGI